MPTLWFALVAIMLAMYVVLDGFDIGAGIVHHWAARNDAERRDRKEDAFTHGGLPYALNSGRVGLRHVPLPP